MRLQIARALVGGERVEQKYFIAAGQMFFHATSKIKRRRSGYDDFFIGESINNNFERKSDIGNSLRLINTNNRIILRDLGKFDFRGG